LERERDTYSYEKSQLPDKIAADPSHEAAAAKLWTVYVSEADKDDRGFMQSWNNDMDGMLIFVGNTFGLPCSINHVETELATWS
jgi:hypothetical protein